MSLVTSEQMVPESLGSKSSNSSLVCSVGEGDKEVSNPKFIERVGNIPIVNSTLEQITRIYDHSKNKSNVLKYGAESVEYSVKAIWNPVASRLESKLCGLDSYACHQLDKLERDYPMINENPTEMLRSSKVAISNLVNRLVVDVNSSAILSNCIEFLKGAESYIEHLLSQLRNSIAESQIELETQLETWSENVNQRKTEAKVKATALTKQIQAELVLTIKGVVDLINSSTGGLPVTAKATLKSLILSLPKKFMGPIDDSAHRVMNLANEAIILIKSILKILTLHVASHTISNNKKDD